MWSGSVLFATLVLVASNLLSQQVGSSARNQLADIVGTWQSDTTGGVSALSTCSWSPQGRAVICEQTINAPTGERATVNVFIPDSSRLGYIYYGVSRPGQEVEPTPLHIAGHIWVYGGQARAADSLYYRTVNDFSTDSQSYVWRQEYSRDGVNWVVQRHGRAARKGAIPASR